MRNVSKTLSSTLQRVSQSNNNILLKNGSKNTYVKLNFYKDNGYILYKTRLFIEKEEEKEDERPDNAREPTASHAPRGEEGLDPAVPSAPNVTAAYPV